MYHWENHIHLKVDFEIRKLGKKKTANNVLYWTLFFMYIFIISLRYTCIIDL